MLTSYESLQKRFRQIHSLENAMAILGWDEAVMMPSGSSESRNQTMAELSGMVQTLTKAPEVGDWLAESSQASELSDWDRANLREMKRIYQNSTAIPTELNQKLVMARLNCEQKWRTLRAQNDWQAFMPLLRGVLELTRESLGYLSAAQDLSLYDAALSLYSNGLTTVVVQKLFSEIKSFLPGLIEQVVQKQKSEVVIRPEGPFPQSAQKALGQDLMRAVGFSFANGRLDESHHPFCGGTAADVRITTRYDEADFIPALMGVLHETGHALYEQHLPARWIGQPVSLGAGMAIHESQSLLMEMQVCRSSEFMEFAQPFILKHLGPHTKNVEALSPANLTALVTRVKPGYIRVDADEVSYPAHVILRFELERDLLEGSLDLSDLPAAWDAKMKAYLGLSTLGNDRNGCMQDVHWPSGAFGYFPAYTFGAVIAAQLFSKITETHPEIRSDIAKGNFMPLQSWLEEKIWSQGSKLTTLDLVEQASGRLSANSFRTHLSARYLASR